MRRIVSAALLVLLSTGCVSVRTRGTRPAPDEEAGGVSVVVYPDDASRRAARPGPLHVVAELQQRRDDRWVTVFRSLEPAWTVLGLEPGRYRLQLPAVLDEAGAVVELTARPEIVRVRQGEVVEVEATLDHVSPALVAAGVVGVVVAAVLLEDWLDDHDLPTPPRPPRELVEALADSVFWVGVTVHSDLGSYRGADPPPGVTSHFPADGEEIAIPRPRILFVLSEPVEIEDDRPPVLVLSEREGLLEGTVSYDMHRWWIVWEPDADLPSGDVIHVTLHEEAVEDASGQELPFATSFSFGTR
jgi:hypothetical protein